MQNWSIQWEYNDDANKIIEQENLNFLIYLAIVTNDTKPIPEEPKTFNKAWDHPNKNSCKKWWEAIGKVFTNMNKQQVWCKTCKSLMPPNCRCETKKRVFKIKHNSVYQVHLMACKYSQVSNFAKNYSLVVNNVAFCILLLMVLHFGY